VQVVTFLRYSRGMVPAMTVLSVVSVCRTIRVAFHSCESHSSHLSAVAYDSHNRDCSSRNHGCKSRRMFVEYMACE
jgi:hypothetical protein